MGQPVPVDDLPENAVPEDDLPDRFSSTPGGAATGNPLLQVQGRKSLRPDVGGLKQVATEIGQAGISGATLGAIGGDALEAIGRVAGSFPQGRVIGPALENTGRVLKAHRVQGAIMGGVGGLASESAGQAAEGAGASPLAAEAIRFAAGALTPETAKFAKDVLQRYVVTPSLSLFSKGKKEIAKGVLAKLEGGELKTLSEKEAEYLNQLRDEIRGGPKSDADLTGVGNAMEGEAARREGQAITATRFAENQAQNLAPITARPVREAADIGGELNTAINNRLGVVMAARDRSYKANQAARDGVVKAKEAAGQFVNQTQEYLDLVSTLKAELKPGVRSESVQAGIRKILSDLESFGTTPATQRLSGQGDFLETVPAKAGPMRFQALDDVRRKLGEAYRGKPAEGYDAIGEGMARDLYSKVSNIQKQYAGPAQQKLLDDYALQTEGLEVFHSMRGKKATALDRHDPSQFATDPSALPTTYFKTRASVEALKELTGNTALVNRAAIDHAARELQGLTAPQAREWMRKNSEWLGEVPMVRSLADRYATRLEGVERGLANAKEFAEAVSRDANLLRGKALPAQRAVDLIKSGDQELWAKAAPAITTQQQKEMLFRASRQVLADEATSAGVINFFDRNLRPFLEKTGAANASQLDFMAERLAQIKNLKLPEEQKLGMAKRLLLQGMSSEMSSLGARGLSEWNRDKAVPD